MMPSAYLSRAVLARWRVTGSGVLLGALLLGPAPAHGANCGDNVNGRRVACACGDVVVSDTALSATDPVAVERCTSNGLLVLAPAGSDGLTVDLGGLSIVGAGRGAGIRVVRGGRLGARILGGDADGARAEIAGFDTGIRAHGSADLREVRGIDVHHNKRYGLKIHASGVLVNDVRSSANGKDGVALTGHGIEVSGVASEDNLRDGIRIRGAGAVLDGETTGNGRNGAVIGGRGAQVRSLSSSNNAAAGVVATGSGHVASILDVDGNAGGDVAGRAGALR